MDISAKPSSDTVDPSAPQVRNRLIIVDDDASNRELLAHIFRSTSDVVEVDNGAAALNALGTGQFDAMLLDINLPDMSGFEVLKAVRAHLPMDALPIILISARDGTQDIVTGLHAGATDYIVKPINIDIVRARVHAQLRYKQLNDQHRETIQDLLIAQKMQQRFYRVVSHDIKGPLTNLRMAQYLLRDLLSGHVQASAILENIDLSLNELQELIRIYLDVAALAPGQVEAAPTCINLKDILRNVVRQYSMAASKKNIRLQYQERDALVMADPRLISQMFSNLVSNAIKFSPASTVTRIWTEQIGTRLRVSVADQGPGISPEEQIYLFQMYSKLTPRPTAQETSTGLGLWIVRHLAELQDGDVGVNCPPEGGSVFWIEVPVATIDG
jgi:signal transduction histidine kinase